MTRILTAYVHVTGENGVPVILAPGDELVDEYADQVTNPKAFREDGEKSEDSAPAKKAPAKKAASRPRGRATTKPDQVPAQSSNGDQADGSADGGDGGGDSSGADESGASQQ